MGLPGWKARFAPDHPGQHTVVARLKDKHGLRVSATQTFVCGPSQSKGFIRVTRKDPRFLEFSHGQPFFPIGQNLAFIGPAQHVTLSRAEGIFTKLGANGANYLRIWTCCEDWAMAIEARKSAWGRSWDWRPPLERASTPESSNRWVLKLSTDRPALKLEPSHPVALRPDTQYVLRGWLKTDGDSRMRLELPKAWLWVFTPGGAWASLVTHGRTPPTMDSVELELRDWPAGMCRIQWWDTWKGSVVRDDKASVHEGVLRFKAPPFSRDIACKIEPDL